MNNGNQYGAYPLARPGAHPTDARSNAFSPIYALGPEAVTVGVWATAFRLDVPPTGTPNPGPGTATFTAAIGETPNMVIIPGLPYNFDHPVKIATLTSNLNLSMMLTYLQAGSLTTVNSAAAPSPIDPPALMQVNGVPADYIPLQGSLPASGNVGYLNVGNSSNIVLSAYPAGAFTGDQIVCLQTGSAKITVQTAPTATVTVEDQHGNALALFNPALAAPVFSIPAGDPAGTTYYVNTAQLEYVNLVSTDTTVGRFWVDFSSLPAIPPLPKNSATATMQFQGYQIPNATTGILIPATSGKSIRLYRLDIVEGSAVTTPAQGNIYSSSTNTPGPNVMAIGYSSGNPASYERAPWVFQTLPGDSLNVSLNSGTLATCVCNVWYDVV